MGFGIWEWKFVVDQRACFRPRLFVFFLCSPSVRQTRGVYLMQYGVAWLRYGNLERSACSTHGKFAAHHQPV